MSVERLIAAKNISQIQRILKFYDSLIIKNENEAKAAETELSENNFYRYRYAREGDDTFIDYEYTKQDMIDAELFAESMDIYSMNDLLFKKDKRALTLIKTLRQRRIDAYDEMNPYFRVFTGKPLSTNEFVYVTNDDKVEPEDPDKVAIHEITERGYPKTYDRLYTKRTIEVIIQQFPDLQYLKFSLNKKDPIFLRDCPQFTILAYDDTALQSGEFDRFYECYEKARSKILLVDFIQGYDERFESYSNLMLMLLLHQSFLLFCNSYIRAFALRDYTENEIFEILDSNGLSNLKTVDITILKKVVERLPELTALRGTDVVIDKILDIIQVKDINIKRYQLVKTYATNSAYVSGMDTSLGYDESVKLEFIESVVRGSKPDKPVRYDYHTFVNEDPFWGGRAESSPEVQHEVKEKLRREILSLDFASIQTKYLNVSRVIEILEKTAAISDYLGLLFQFDEERNFLYADSTMFRTLQISPINLWAALCWGTSIANGIPSPESIRVDAFALSDVMRMRKTTGLARFADEIAEDQIEIGSLSGSLRLGSVLKLKPDDKLTNYLVSFNIGSNTTLGELFKQHGNNRRIIETVRANIASSSSIAEYNAWAKIDQYNNVTKRIDDLFGGATTYNGFIQGSAPDFFNAISVVFAYDLSVDANKEIFNALMEELSLIFREYIYTKSSEVVKIPSDRSLSSGGDTSLDHIRVLLKEFVSIYTELYKIEYDQIFSLPLENTVRPLYALYTTVKMDKTQEILNLLEKMTSSRMYSKTTETFELVTDVFSKKKSKFSDQILPSTLHRYKLLQSLDVAKLSETVGITTVPYAVQRSTKSDFITILDDIEERN